MRRTALAVAALLFGVQAHAGAITQTTFFDSAADATADSFSSGRDPALAPLGAGVTIAAATPDRGAGDAYQVTNPIPSAISFNPLFSDSVNPEADAFYNMAPVLVNPGRGQRPEFTPRPVLSSGYPLSSTRMMNLSPFVGTGLSFASELTLSKDNNDLIKVANSLVNVQMLSYRSVQADQKVTHRFTPRSLPVDSETLVMATLALAVAVGVAWRVRRIAPGPRLARRDAYQASSRDAKPRSDRARWAAASPVVLDLGADFFGERPGDDGDHGTRNV